MDFKIFPLGASTVKPFSKELGFSLHQLSKWNKNLDLERLKTIHAQQDLKKQKKLAKKHNLQLNKQVTSIEEEAVLIASELEQQKTKHQHLLVLVQKAQQQIYQQKLDKYQDVINKKQPDEFEECKKILIENEKKLQKILEKLNSSEFQISKKIDLIRALRRERGIHSNVFDKLEKEHFDVEFYYKQLLIERTLLQKQLEKHAAQFNHIYQKSNLELSKINRGEKHLSQGEVTQNTQSHRKTQEQSKKPLTTFRFPELTFQQKELHITDRFKSRGDLYGSKIMDKKNLDDSKKLEFKKKLKDVLNDIGCESFNDAVKNDIFKNVNEEQNAFDESNNICDEIFIVQHEIKKLEKELHKRKNFQSQNFSKKKLNLHSQISQFEAEAEQTKTEVANFKSEFENILKGLVTNDNEKQSFSASGFKPTIKSENTQKLTFSQNHQIVKEMMAFFNDQLLQGYLNGLRTGLHSRSKVIGEKGYSRKKHNKISSIGVEKKVRIMRTETDNSNQSSYSIRNSEFLENILSMHNPANQKIEKAQKIDNLMIMTEDELIEESKRLIRQIKKKKSEFLSNGSIISKKQPV